MAHKQQQDFCKMVKGLYPNHFRNVQVVDIGSCDINGNNRGLFYNSYYVGVDLAPGKNVDVIGYAHEVLPNIEHGIKGVGRQAGIKMSRETKVFDTVISTEALEHDKHFEYTLKAMYNILKPNGLLLITAAGEGRPEHGTYANEARSSPTTLDYYKNVTNEMFLYVLHPLLFSEFFIRQNNTDFQFFGIKSI